VTGRALFLLMTMAVTAAVLLTLVHVLRTG